MLNKAKAVGKLLALGGALVLNPGCKKKQEIANFSDVDTVMEIGVLVNEDPCNIFEIQKWIMERAREVILEILESSEKMMLRVEDGGVLYYGDDSASYTLSLNFNETSDLTLLTLYTDTEPGNEHIYPQAIQFIYSRSREDSSVMVWSNDEYDLETLYFQSGRLADKLALGRFGPNAVGEEVWATECRHGPEEVATHIQFLKELEELAKSILPEAAEEPQPEQAE